MGITETEIEQVKSIVRKLQQPDGWTPVMQIGKELKKDTYQSWGYLKCGDVFKQNTDIFEQYLLDLDDQQRDGKTARTALYVKVKGDACQEKPSHETSKVSKEFSLFEWAYMPGYKEALCDLARKAEKENWGENDKVLDNYIKYTFLWLYKNHKVKINNECAVFNTGLLRSLTYESIYAVFVPNKKEDKQKWYFKAFTTVSEAFGQYIIKFNPYPERPSIANAAQMVYQTEKRLEPNFRHILIHNLHRFPSWFIEEVGIPTEWIGNNPDKMDNEARRVYDQELEDKFEHDEECRFADLLDRFTKSVEKAQRRVANNYRIAVPIWHPELGINYLLPLALSPKKSDADLALVVQYKPDSETYIAKTIYLLDWAYTYARLLVKPTDEWLKVL